MAGQTISSASGKLYLTSTSNPLTITSTGSVTTTASGDAINAPSGTAWQINNAGTISGVIGSSSAGIYSPATGISVQNTGKISGYVAGLWLSSGGAVTNGASGLISATGSYGVYIAGAAGVVTNLGTITGSSYAVDLTFSSAANRVVVAPGAVFNGLVSGGNGVLELAGSGAAGTLSGTIGGTSGSFENFSQIVVDSGAVWALSGALKISTVQLGGSLEVASDTTPSTQINFASGGKLTIDNTASFSGSVLSNFAAGDIIDIHNFAAAGAAISYNSSTGVAQISNGSQTATLDFKPSTLGAGALQVASDGGTGVVLTLSQPTAPAAPTIASPASGSIDTTTAEPVISGGGVSGDTVTLSIDGTQVGTAPVVNGAWTFTPTSPLSNASHTVAATQAASGGPSSTAATDAFTVNVPTAPAAPTIASPASGSIDTTTAEPVISGGGVSGDTVTLSIDGTQVGTAPVVNGAWTFTPTSPLSNASHTVAATQAASGGPSSTAATDAFTVNVPTAPAAPTIASPASGSIDTTTAEPVISGGGVSGDTVTLSIDGTQVGTAPVVNGAWTFTPTSPLSNASHTVAATQAASGGPSSTAATDAFTVNVPTAPAAPTIASPASGSIDTTTAEPVISGGGVSGDTVTLSIDGTQVGTAPVVNGAWTFTPTSPLSNASHTVAATQAASGGPSSTAATDAFTVNVPTAPAAPTIASPASGSIDTTTAEPVISGGGVSGDTVTLSIDGTQVGTAPVVNGAWTFTPTSPLSNASHTVAATQAASGGPSSTAATDAFTVNVPTAPAAPTIASPASGSIDTTTAEPVISGGGVSGDTVTLSIDGTQVGTAPVVNGAWTFTPTSPLSNASHTVAATQAASGGPSSTAATDAFTVNVPTAPAAPTIASPASGSIDTTTAEPVISGGGVSGDTVTLSIDGTQVGTAPVVNGAWTFTPTSPLSNASHTVAATQAASGGPSSTAATDAFTVNVPTAPAAPTIASPASGSIDTTTAEPVISGGGVSGDTVTLSIDGTQVGTAPVVNGAWTFTPTSPLSNASHTVAATQAASGGPSSTAATDAFTVNVPTAPAAPTIASPASGSIDTTTAEPVISGGGVSGDTVTLSIDGTQVGTAPVVNGAWTFTPTSPLSNASHTVAATQAASGGPSSTAATDAFTVNVSGGGLTISGAITGPLTLAATNNPLTITSAGSVKATASGADGVDGGSGTAWSITNSGTVASSQRYGISLHSAGSSIVNSGSISGYAGSGGYGVDLEAGGTVTVTNTSAGYITGGEDAIFGYGAAANIDNSGQIVSTFDDGIGLFGGGRVINRAGGVIRAPTAGGYGPAGVYIPGGSANVVNHGSISGQYGVYLGVAGTVENAGTISGSSSAVTFAVSSAANRLIIDPGAVFSGSVKGNGGVLELTAGTGSIGSIGSSSFSGFQTLIDDLGGDWTLTGSNTIANVTDNGSLVAAGSLHVTTAVTSASAGQFELQAGASLEVAADSAANSQIDFLGASQLTIDNAALFGTGVGGSSYAGPQLEDFGVGDTVDLHSFSGATAALLYNPASGLLQVTNGSSQVATLDFQNSTLGSGSFSFASDGSGGVKISHG